MTLQSARQRHRGPWNRANGLELKRRGAPSQAALGDEEGVVA